MSGQPSWAILIPTIPRRAPMFKEVVQTLCGQIERWDVTATYPRIDVIAWLNRGEPRLPEIRDRMVEFAWENGVEYVSFVDDDDLVSDSYVKSIADVLWPHRPDHVGFRLRYTKDGEEVYRGGVVHNLGYGQWGYNPAKQMLYRDFTHLDPIKTSIARRGRFASAYPWAAEDRQWCDQVRPHLKLARDHFIDQELYHYRWVPALSSWEHRSAIDLGQGRTKAERPNYTSSFLHWMPESL